MTEREMAEALTDLFDQLAYMVEEDPDVNGPRELANTILIDAGAGIDRVGTFEARGVLTGNQGVVVEMHDGSQFQLTVVRSR